MSEHTPTPWRIFTNPDGTKLVGIGGQDGEGILDAGFGVWAWDDPQGMANAALIVRAVNAHAQLIADVAEWKQAAAVEAGLRREFYDKNAKLSAALNKVNDWLVCHAIASDEDMAQSFPTMCEIVNDALASLKESE
jgi:hypothetical protein